MHARELVVGDERLPAVYHCSYCEKFYEGKPSVTEGVSRSELIDELYDEASIISVERILELTNRCDSSLVECPRCDEDDDDYDIYVIEDSTVLWRCRNCSELYNDLDVAEDCCK